MRNMDSVWTLILRRTAYDLRRPSCYSANPMVALSSPVCLSARRQFRRWPPSWACRATARAPWARRMDLSGSHCATARSRSLSRGCATYISTPFLDAWEIDRRMCGIIGVAGVPDAGRITYLGLYSLQHRGQESAGLVAIDGAGVARAHRGMGLVSDVFTESVLGTLPGDVAIGHTRYSTAGTSVIAN